jgi:meso-butanediol dehydrogenase / (S,S)-butanediol dehydrogenase / diacetyl reductase
MTTENLGGIVITGAARGIGLGVAETLAQSGYGVVIADIDDAAGRQAATGIATSGGKAIFARTDVSDRASVAAAIKRCEEAFGFLHGIVNNAGFNRPQPFLETTEDNWNRIMTINGLGVMIGMQEAAKAMIAAGHKGKIVSTASMAGRTGFGDFAPYCASKAAVISLTQAAARVLAPRPDGHGRFLYPRRGDAELCRQHPAWPHLAPKRHRWHRGLPDLACFRLQDRPMSDDRRRDDHAMTPHPRTNP